MSEVNERTERLHAALGLAAEALGSLTDEQRAAASGGAELLERVVAYAQVVVSQTDGDLVTDGAFSAIESGATGISNDPVTTAGSARTYADALLSPLTTFPAARDRDVEQSVKEIAANFQRSTSKRLNALETEIASKRAAVERSLAQLRESVGKEATELGTRIDVETAALQTKLDEFETTLTAQRQAISQALERQSETFSQAQEERSESFQAEIANSKEELTSMLNDAGIDVEARVREIRRMEEESSGLVHSIGLGGTAERFGEEWDSQRKVADKLRTLTILLALAAVAMAVFAVVRDVEDTSAVLAKLGVSLVLGALATYTARQSGRHRAREERARALQLELTAFAPFVSHSTTI
jgi:hypothetical protein